MTEYSVKRKVKRKWKRGDLRITPFGKFAVGMLIVLIVRIGEGILLFEGMHGTSEALALSITIGVFSTAFSIICFCYLEDDHKYMAWWQKVAITIAMIPCLLAYACWEFLSACLERVE